MASHNQSHGRRHERFDQLKKHRTLAWHKLSVLTGGLLLVVSLLLQPATKVEAQSGRKRAPQPAASPRQQSSPQQRARRTSSTASTQTAPAQTKQPAPSVSLINMTSDAPPVPTPTPSQTPASAPASTTTADTEAGEEVDAADVVRISSNLVTVPASVVDEQGRAVIDLKLEDFELRVDGQPKEISELGRSETPVRMAVLFDNSMSLSAAREFEKKAAIKFFRSVLRPIDQAAIYSIWTVPIFVQPFTSDVRALVRTIERFGDPEDGATALFDTVAQAADYLRPHQGRKVIIIISDGADTLSNIDFLTSLKKVMTADVQVYAVQTGQLENANLYNLSAHHRLQEYASQTGGAVYVPRLTTDLDTAFSQISADLSQQYVLSYYPQDARNDGRFRTISLRVKTRPNTRVRARKGYYDRAGQKQVLAPLEDTNPVVNQPESARSTAIAATGTADEDQPVIPAGLERNGLTSNATTTSVSNGSRRTQGGSNSVGPPGPDDDLEQRTSRVETNRNTIASNAPSSASATAAPSSTNSVRPTPSASPTPSPSPTPAATQTPAPSQTQTSTEQKPAEPPPAPKKPLSGGVLNGKALVLPKPVYPAAAKSFRLGGTVVVEVLIDESGKVVSARALSGPPMLQTAAVQAARLAKFSPTKLSGQPVQVIGTINYSFLKP
jgi:VWFA-related protein/TonB family protein